MSARRVNIEETYRRIMAKMPLTMARLADETPQPLVLPHYMAMELEAIRDGKPSPTGRDQAGIDAEAAAGILATSFIMPKP
jgi:hypothetical protein